MQFLSPDSSIDYQLIDSGRFRKLERFGQLILDRPEIKAKWEPSRSKKEWESADWHFYEKKGKTGLWTTKNNAPSSWAIDYNFQGNPFTFLLKITSFKHVGIFPEQAVNWNFMQQQLQRIRGEKKVLNLFAYTAAASIIAAKCGAKVTNVDSVKQVINWGKENAQLNRIDSIRWIQEDARKFVDRAIRRKDSYHGIILDPPTFGYGAKNEKWLIDQDLFPLIEKLSLLLNPDAHFFILNTYSSKMSFSSLDSGLKKIIKLPKSNEKSTLGLCSEDGTKLALGELLRFWH